MHRLFAIIAAAAVLLLTGCATTINSNVTAFHAWPAELPDKSFVFAPTKTQSDSLEYRNYEQLIRTELLRLGFTDTRDGKPATLKVAFNYGVQTATVVVTQPVYDPFWYGSGYGRWGAVRPWGPYDPFWGQPLQQTAFPVFQRLLALSIERTSNGQKLYEVTVESEGSQATLPMAMPYMVRSAFSEFPGPSGVSRYVKLKLDKPGQATTATTTTAQ